MSNDLRFVLVADDDEANRSALGKLLESKGCTVTAVPDGTAALELLEPGGFDLVFLNVEMPGGNGLEVLQAIRQAWTIDELPVIMVTGKDTTAGVAAALQAGASDYVTRPFDPPVVLARIQTQLTLRRLTAQLEAANRRMHEDLEAAARVQEALLPDEPPQVPGAEVAWRFRPCAELAGDLLDIVPVGERQVALYMLDVVDHGIRSALLATMVSRAMAQLHEPYSGQGPRPGRKPPSPAAVAAHLNRSFPWDERTQQFFTLLYGILDLDAGEFCFVSAGHPGPLHVSRDKGASVFKAPGLPIGLGEGDYEEHRLALRPGDRLYLYSDGVPDTRGQRGEAFGLERFRDVLERSRGRPLHESLEAALSDVSAWCGASPPRDDLSLIGVEVAANGNGRPFTGEGPR